jgi:hypothetical protein
MEDKRLERKKAGGPPFDPKTIHIDTKPIPLEAVLRRLKQGTLLLSPDFQRNLVWKKKQKSLLIESLMLNIPIPLFYVSADPDNNWAVIDGLQRLTAIKEFCLDKSFRLSGLEYLQQFEGCTFDEVSPIYINRILESTFQFVIVEPTTDEHVKFNIFKRINTGGTALNSQEIRHAMYYGPGVQLLDTLAVSEELVSVYGTEKPSPRMKRQENILRSLSFILLGYESYGKDASQDAFLIDCLMVMNSLGRKGPVDPTMRFCTLEELSKAFLTGVRRGMELFGQDAFRIPRNNTRGAVNGSLFEVITSLLSEIDDEEFEILQMHKKKLHAHLSQLVTEKEFNRSISRDAWKPKNVHERFSKITLLMKEVVC